MIHPIIVNAQGKVYNDYPNGVKNVWKHLKSTFNTIFNAPLKPSRIIMSKDDYDDILKWSGESDI